MKIVGFTGFKGAGKDTAADALVACGWGWIKMSFADALRTALWTLNPVIGHPDHGTGLKTVRWQDAMPSDGNAVQYEAAKRMYPEVRRLQQVFGTDVVRKTFGDDVWIDRLWEKIRDLPTSSRVVIPDVRFNNEAARIAFYGEVFRVHRPGLVPDGHVSEVPVDDVYLAGEFSNEGTVEDLQSAVVRWSIG